MPNTPPKKIVLLGVGPIPPQKAAKTYAPGWYTWALLQLILGAGHKVLLGLAEFGGSDGDDSKIPLDQIDLGENFESVGLSLNPAIAAEDLLPYIDTFAPDGIVAYTDIMANAACRLDTESPRYIIYYGHPMAERQMQAYVGGSDAAVRDMWMMILPALLGGDRFGATSTGQESALIGELGSVGRLNRNNVFDSPVDLLPVSVMNVKQAGEAGRIKGNIIPEDAFMVFWMGGYNTWSDEETLFKALENAMERESNLYYVSAGGGIKGHVEETYKFFIQRVERSQYRDRFKLQGWLKWDDLGEYFADADCAVCTDRPTLEGRLGARTRIMDLLLNEVPVVANVTDEASRELSEMGYLSLAKPGDWEGLASEILKVAKAPQKAKDQARRASEFLHNEWTTEKRWLPLLNWIENPSTAPDLIIDCNAALRATRYRPGPYNIKIPDNPLAMSQMIFMEDMRLEPEKLSVTDYVKHTIKKILHVDK